MPTRLRVFLSVITYISGTVLAPFATLWSVCGWLAPRSWGWAEARPARSVHFFSFW